MAEKKSVTITSSGAPIPEVTEAVSKALTIYEQTVKSDHDIPREDDQYIYITVPHDMPQRMIAYFRRGYTVAESHPGNDAHSVVLKKDKQAVREEYERECLAVAAAISQEVPTEAEKAAGYTVSRAERGRPRTIEDLVDALPDKDPEQDES